MANTAVPFGPLGASVAVTAPSGSGSTSTTIPGAGGDVAHITNTVAFPVSLIFSTTAGGAVGTATGVTIPASSIGNVSIPIGTTDVSVWGIGGTGAVYVQRGSGGV